MLRKFIVDNTKIINNFMYNAKKDGRFGNTLHISLTAKEHSKRTHISLRI